MLNICFLLLIQLSSLIITFNLNHTEEKRFIKEFLNQIKTTSDYDVLFDKFFHPGRVKRDSDRALYTKELMPALKSKLVNSTNIKIYEYSKAKEKFKDEVLVKCGKEDENEIYVIRYSDKSKVGILYFVVIDKKIASFNPLVTNDYILISWQ